VQQQLAKVGIKSHPNLLESTAVAKNVGEGKFDLMFYGFGFNPEPATYESLFQCDQGYAAYACDPKINELFKAGKATSVEADRHKAYDEIQKIVNEDVPFFPVYRQIARYAINKRVQNFDQGGLAWMLYPWDTGENDALKWSVTQ
jgi:ABC-type transport system substrate-binding protein